MFFELSSIEILANHIIAFREKRGLSQEAFADMCNLHRTYIGSIERFERNVSLKTLEVIAKAIGIPLFQLFIPSTLNNVGEINRANGKTNAPVPPHLKELLAHEASRDMDGKTVLS